MPLAYPETELDVVTLAESDAAAAIAAVETGTIDATFRAVTVPPGQLPRTSARRVSRTARTNC
ncbi:hypothetical protein AB0M79_30815 [Polymorphospora sp. NPDC051019]|uniref:hypothetical protein n=1 Tax=Polymorphospora sp. NPDC051019 TaxID=3155725 RepID=UPI003449CF44